MIPLRIGRGLVLAIAAMMAAFFLYAAARRLVYPHELEWMPGSILDHVERVRAGQPIYVAPSSDWIPFMYPPLYYSARPSWILRLRREPLPTLARDALERRQRIEMGLAVLRMQALRSHAAIDFDARAIEDLARRIAEGTLPWRAAGESASRWR